MPEFDFPKRVFSPNLVFGRHADTKPVRSLVERLARHDAECESNPFDEADALARTLEQSEWGDAVVRYPPLPDKPFVSYARQYYLFLRGRLVARRRTAVKTVKEAVQKANKMVARLKKLKAEKTEKTEKKLKTKEGIKAQRRKKTLKPKRSNP